MERRAIAIRTIHLRVPVIRRFIFIVFIALCSIITMFMVAMRMLRAATVCLSSFFFFNGVSIPPVTIPEFVVKEPSRNPVRATVDIIGELPIIACVGIARIGNPSHSFILGILEEIAPVVWGLPFAVTFSVTLLGR